jgi:transcriptional regulator with XRE-family HTH domain
MENFHTRLRHLRKARGLTMKEFANKIGVPQSTYRDWEYGGTISGQPYIRMALILNVSLYELLDGKRQRSNRLLNITVELESLVKELKKELDPLL